MSRIGANDQAERVIHDPVERAAGPTAAGPQAARPTIKVESAEERPDEAVGQIIGRYKVLQKIGEGGCGAVYMAEQEQPVRRRVALKVIKLGMDTRAVIARFEAERQALALMDHPNIAKVLDAGATETGRPYFVMELVRGIKFTDYCDQNHLGTRERLELFIQICQAIQHAHQKGIIHRDIKPSNILVTLHDGVPVPKVIDFGIAKATTDQRLTDKTLFTAYEQFIGTPAYMSPEQAELSGLDIDTRTDIYSLGVLLYELLTGRTPFDPKQLAASGLDAMRRTIREKEPLRPSTKLQTLAGAELTATAKRHGVDAPRLVSQMRGDLDWIVLKCLEKDRRRRYETANGLAADLRRHLNNELVTACPPSTAYRIHKAIRRHRLAFAGGAALATALVLGVIGTTLGLLQARRARALALQSRAEAEKLANFMLEDFYAKLEPSGQFDMVAQLARQAVDYYASLPPSLRTPETERNRAMAQARLALITARQGDPQDALQLALAAGSSFDPMLAHGDRSEPTLFGSGLALFAQAWSYRLQNDARSQASVLQRGAELLQPLATAPQGSRRIKLMYADLLDQLGHLQPGERSLATYEQALGVLAGLGALDWRDPTAAAAWADTADSEAREALRIGRLDDAERLEKRSQTLAEGVLTRRPGDLRAMKDLGEAADVLALTEAHRFHEAEALALASKSRRAVEDYLRFNPSAAFGWFQLAEADYLIAAVSFRVGRVTESLRQLRAGAQLQLEQNRSADNQRWVAILLEATADWEAQRENGAAAEEALQQARRCLDAYFSRVRAPARTRALGDERFDTSARHVKLALGQDATVYTMARSALNRLEGLRQEMSDSDTMGHGRLTVSEYEADALADSAQAALNLGRYAEAETAAQALLALGALNDYYTYESLLDHPADGVWGRVLLAQAVLGQGRREEALKGIEPALMHYREAQARGATDVFFRLRFARALYVQALAEPADAAGRNRRQAHLLEANRLLQGLSDEARQLHDSKELLSWITSAQNPGAQAKK